MKKKLFNSLVVGVFSVCMMLSFGGMFTTKAVDRDLCSTTAHCPPGLCCSFDGYCTPIPSSDCM